MRIANFYTLGNQFIFQIPKKRGIGYLKSVTGFHSINDKGIKLTDALEDKKYIDDSVGAFCDLDGYLAINVKKKFANCLDKSKEIEHELKEIIKDIFEIDYFIEE